MPKINFFTEDISFRLQNKLKIRQWLSETATAEGKKINELNFIFCSDEYLLQINIDYLQHNTFTDIVTFDNGQAGDNGRLTGDIFISVDRVYDNAEKFKVSKLDELHRVMVHGTLHLLGYKDKSKSDKKLMTLKEDHYLGKRAL